MLNPQCVFVSCRAHKEAKKTEAQALEAKAAAEAEVAALTASHEESASKVEQAQQEASRMADELRDYKVRSSVQLAAAFCFFIIFMRLESWHDACVTFIRHVLQGLRACNKALQGHCWQHLV